MRFTRRSLALAALAACASLTEGSSAPSGEFITTLDGDGGPPIGETYVGTPGTSTLTLNSLANVAPDVRARPARVCGERGGLHQTRVARSLQLLARPPPWPNPADAPFTPHVPPSTRGVPLRRSATVRGARNA